MLFQVLTSLILTVHAAYLAYVVVGGFLAWRWPRTVWLHLVASAWGLLIVTNPWGWQCPLTYAEHWSRRRAGQEGFTAGFVDRYLEGVLYPERYTRALQVLVGVLVVVSWIGVYLRWRRDTARKSRAADRSPTTV
ncbi:MAG TPA: DUF2784 domain-containing protein [Natronosporangium sp.]|nr:DUF2784 domain-containing protein [Natronosporangium sp.]